ncbi:hypothetical protein Tco_1180264 [Tanacetum coccineum]
MTKTTKTVADTKKMSMFSYSESYSAATTATVADTKKEDDEDGEVTARRLRSPAVRGEMGQPRKVVREKSLVDEVVMFRNL